MRLAAAALAGISVPSCDRPPEHRGQRDANAETGRPAPAPAWTTSELGDLLHTVQAADREGLRPADYGVDALKDATAGGRTGAAVDAIGNGAALALSRDFAAGRIRNRHRFNWYIDYAGPSQVDLFRQLTAARTQGRLGAFLNGLLPTSADYGALRETLATLPPGDGDRRDRILANMERWRWLPRDVGQGDQLYVNLPTYRLEVIESGRTTATYRAVIGATDMPTPVLSASVRQIVANPDWIVPPSIVRRSHLRPGVSSRYIFSTRPDGTLRVRQMPGPGNALGRVKIEFPNPLAIYFHDTPSKSLFGASERAFSHGCVRVQNVEALAASIVARPDRLATALEGTSTRSLWPARPWRATIVYLTLVGDGEGGGLRFVGDPYRMDQSLAAALEHRKPRKLDAPSADPAPSSPVSAPIVAAPEPVSAPDPSDNGGTGEALPLNATR